MTEVRCTGCGENITVRSRFEVDGECPECGAEAGSLQALDAYDEDPAELQCAACGWSVEAGVRIEVFDESEPRVYSVDDDCPVCEEAGYPGEPLEPADSVRGLRDLPDYATARAAAAKVRREHAGDGIPVDVEAIAAALGLTVRRGRFPHDGLLRDDVIEVPEGHPGAERFVIAHEIGHRCLRHVGDRHKVEPEANAFASEMLVPRDVLRRELGRPQTISALARRFGVSRPAAVYAVRAARLLDRLSR
jgi:hypothetical protein